MPSGFARPGKPAWSRADPSPALGMTNSFASATEQAGRPFSGHRNPLRGRVPVTGMTSGSEVSEKTENFGLTGARGGRILPSQGAYMNPLKLESPQAFLEDVRSLMVATVASTSLGFVTRESNQPSSGY